MYRLILENSITGLELHWNIDEAMGETVKEDMTSVAGEPTKVQLSRITTTYADGTELRYDYDS